MMLNHVIYKCSFICIFILKVVINLPINSQNYELNQKSLNVSNNSTVFEEKPICLMEGDIVCPPVHENYKSSYYMATFDKNRLWLKRQIPYFIDPFYTESASKLITDAISELEKETCVKFERLTEQPHDEDYIWIRPINGCFSSVGRTTGKQDLSLSPACLTAGTGTIVHELIHSLGIWHEHTRPDRDTYIHVYFEHIITEAQANFKKRPSYLVDLLGEPYDYYSIMHYGTHDYSIDSSLPTLLPLDEAIDAVRIGQRTKVSELDKQKLDKLYKCDIKECPQLVSPTKGKIQNHDINVGSVVKFECDPGLTLVGSSERYCRYDGKWSGHEVLCIEKLSHYCNFETADMCGWTKTSDSKFDWKLRSGAAPRDDTGPIEDYTYEASRGHYIFMETSAPQRRGDIAKIETPELSSGSESVCISFAYYMWGDNLGTLSLYISEKSIWKVSGNQGPHWVEVKLVLEQKEAFRLIFEGIVGSRGSSDIALDEVLVLQCNKDDAIQKGYTNVDF